MNTQSPSDIETRGIQATRPIIMSGDNPKLILDGRKTQTRRIVKGEFKQYEEGWSLNGDHPQSTREDCCPYGAEGDRLWVRETWQPAQDGFGRAAICYKSNEHYRTLEQDKDCTVDEWLSVSVPNRNHWRLSIHMPRWASRITLEITKVRVERLQDISGSDVVAEGITYPVNPSEKFPGKCSVLWNISDECSPLNYIAEKDKGDHDKILIAHYAALWDSLHGKGAWDANPWVWVIEFCLSEQQEKHQRKNEETKN